jgi:hypothetical protein
MEGPILVITEVLICEKAADGAIPNVLNIVTNRIPWSSLNFVKNMRDETHVNNLPYRVPVTYVKRLMENVECFKRHVENYICGLTEQSIIMRTCRWKSKNFNKF